MKSSLKWILKLQIHNESSQEINSPHILIAYNKIEIYSFSPSVYSLNLCVSESVSLLHHFRVLLFHILINFDWKMGFQIIPFKHLNWIRGFPIFGVCDTIFSLSLFVLSTSIISAPFSMFNIYMHQCIEVLQIVYID